MVTDEQCLKVLGEPFEPANWILLGDDGDELPCRIIDRGVAAEVIEDAELKKACKVFLRRSGVLAVPDASRGQ